MFLLHSSHAYLEKKNPYIVHSKLSINELALFDMQVQIEQLLVSESSQPCCDGFQLARPCRYDKNMVLAQQMDK